MLNLTFPSHLRRKTRACCFRLHFLSFFIPPPLHPSDPPPLVLRSLSPRPTCAVIYYSPSPPRASPHLIAPFLPDWQISVALEGAAQVAAFSFPARNGFSDHQEASECSTDAYRLRGYSERRSLGAIFFGGGVVFFFFYFEEWCFYVLCSGGISALPLLSRLKGHRVIRLNVS